MAKGTRIELKPDDPLFMQPLQSFVPVSRPSTDDSIKSTDGGSPLEKRRSSQQEQSRSKAERQLS